MALISEAVRGEGAALVDEAGCRFLADGPARRIRAPRHRRPRYLASSAIGRPRLSRRARDLGRGFAARFPAIDARPSRRHRSARSSSRSPGGALSYGRHRRRQRRAQAQSRVVGLRRSGLRRLARRQSARQQFARGGSRRLRDRCALDRRREVPGRSCATAPLAHASRRRSSRDPSDPFARRGRRARRRDARRRHWPACGDGGLPTNRLPTRPLSR